MIESHSLSAVLKLASATAEQYLAQAGGQPLKNFMGVQVAEQLKAHIPLFRPGDLMLIIMRELEKESRGTPEHSPTLTVLSGLDESMRVFAGQLLSWERPQQLDNLEKARRCLNELIKYTPQTIHSEAMIDLVYGLNSTMKAMWAPMQRGASHLVANEEGEALVKLAEGVEHVHDDNDLACLFSKLRRDAIASYLLSEDESAGQLAYEMWQVDRDIMQGEFQQTYVKFMQGELARLNYEYTSSESAKPASRPRHR
ncbi:MULTISPECIES: hypothetical protein [Pseudomonas aeruginosa group]|uniref:hypothetical protein n=1 Tax=Pseudomonas aeruginosa group TaxID=136841 RepID=UPI0003BB4AC2|nr:hypothetical protein [Pseudomonas aeruginosa]ERW61198.1 hypothetical protein Q024_06517 [Pseudomonas aeruginosa BWHPSA011]MBH4465089.1 hypothetical protein [Pseudomonas aeruginosa]MCF3954344.1 hypothetical protein [Pseudomonas aeruginosa]RUC23279.1 hypothetical protein IPC1405_26930 [Pseudomonas aeruginosa]BDF97432.1 hypothetical protein [Pseudomonas aeruginosa]